MRKPKTACSDSAEALADELMNNGLGEKAIRLTLMASYGIMEKPIGSWNRTGLLAAIRKHYPPPPSTCMPTKQWIRLQAKREKPPKRRKRCPGK